jgi:hypothetical protein
MILVTTAGKVGPQLRTVRQRLRRSVLVSPNSHLGGEVS